MNLRKNAKLFLPSINFQVETSMTSLFQNGLNVVGREVTIVTIVKILRTSFFIGGCF